MCCHRSHCPQTSKKHCCYSAACLHKLNNRLWRRHETLDSLEIELARIQSAIVSATRRLERECLHDCRQECTATKAARRIYDDQMDCQCVQSSSGISYRCSCRECAIANKNVEITLLRRKVRAAEDFEDFLQGVGEKRRQCRRQLASK